MIIRSSLLWLLLALLPLTTSFSQHKAVSAKSHESVVVIADGDPPPIDCGLYDICRNSKTS